MKELLSQQEKDKIIKDNSVRIQNAMRSPISMRQDSLDRVVQDINICLTVTNNSSSIIRINPRSPWLLFMTNKPNLKIIKIPLTPLNLRTKNNEPRTGEAKNKLNSNPISR